MSENDLAQTLVTGCGGQLGSELCRKLGPKVIGTDIDSLDITNRQAVRDFVLKHRPKTVINAAAYTAVDQAEEQPDLCNAVNSLAVRNLRSLQLVLCGVFCQERRVRRVASQPPRAVRRDGPRPEDRTVPVGYSDG